MPARRGLARTAEGLADANLRHHTAAQGAPQGIFGVPGAGRMTCSGPAIALSGAPVDQGPTRLSFAPMPPRPAVRPRLVIFDLDGVVYRGSDAVPGAAALIAWLQGRRVAVRYATNNSMASPEAYVDRLGALGIVADAEEVVTSTTATIGYLHRHHPE